MTATVPAGSENTGTGLDIEAGFGNTEMDLENTEVGLEGTGRQNIVPGVPAAGAIRLGSASAGLYIRPEGPFGCCSGG